MRQSTARELSGYLGAISYFTNDKPQHVVSALSVVTPCRTRWN